MAYSKAYISKQKLIQSIEEQEKRRKRLRESEKALLEVRKTTRYYHQAPPNPCELIPVML